MTTSVPTDSPSRPSPDCTNPPEHPWCAATLDVLMWPLKRVRAKVVPAARGRVLEIGVGTGANFEYYGSIERLDGIEPDPHMLRRARERARSLGFPVELIPANAEALPFDDGTFDTALVTWVLCTIPDPVAAMQEVVRVLKPGGRLLFAEHVRSRFPRAASLQDRLTPFWKKIGGGCHLNRDTLGLLRGLGFERLEIKPCGRESWTLLPVYRGAAVKPAG